MDEPTLDQLKKANPRFFSPEWGGAGEILDYRIEEVGGLWYFKVSAPHDTWPVYLIDPENGLSFVREGWADGVLH